MSSVEFITNKLARVGNDGGMAMLLLSLRAMLVRAHKPPRHPTLIRSYGNSEDVHERKSIETRQEGLSQQRGNQHQHASSL